MSIIELIRRLPCGRRLLRRLQSWTSASKALRELGLSPWRRNVVFDVGANDGSTFSGIALAIPWIHVYAFEPTPQLLAGLRKRMSHVRNYHIVPKAVGEAEGIVRFNVAGQGDWGCSSILEFAQNLDKTWPGRTDFTVTETITVDMIRLDAFVRHNGITRIDFLHVDTQGTDLSVLSSLGAEIPRVCAGVIEVPQSHDVMLYKGQHTREQALAWLEEHGFAVWKTVPQQNEDNLFFRRQSP